MKQESFLVTTHVPEAGPLPGVAARSELKSDAMDGEYSQEWAELRRLRRRWLTLAVAGAAIIVLVPFSRLAPGRLGSAVGVGLFIAWVVLLIRFFFVGAEFSYWSCPRCGKPFHYAIRWFGRWNNPFARRCFHCVLPKWVDSDPNPQLKHELNPFRSDSILRLSDPKEPSQDT